MNLLESDGLWTWARSLDDYTIPYGKENGGNFTDVGSKIHSFKYSDQTSEKDKDQIVSYFAKRIMKLIKEELSGFFPSPPFDVCVAVPSNRPGTRSLPTEICSSIEIDNRHIRNGSAGIVKKQSGVVMKNIPNSERSERLVGLYSIDSENMPKVKKGFLVIDDVIETGESTKAICKVLKNAYPERNIYVVILANIFTTKKYLK